LTPRRDANALKELSPINKRRLGKHLAEMVLRSAHQAVAKSDGKSPVAIPVHRWKNIIKMYLNILAVGYLRTD
jgi:hypothetical protein